MALLVSAVVPAPRVRYGAPPSPEDASPGERSRIRPVVVDSREGAVDVVVRDRARLQPGDELHGPVVVTEPTSTTYVQPGWNITVDAVGNLVGRPA